MEPVHIYDPESDAVTKAFSRCLTDKLRNYKPEFWNPKDRDRKPKGHLLVLCKNISRSKSDLNAATANLPEYLDATDIAIIIIHVKLETNLPTVMTSELLPGEKFGILVDFGFSKEKKKLYSCKMNSDSKRSLEKFLDKPCNGKSEVMHNPHVQLYDPEGSLASASFTRCLMALLMEYNPVVHINSNDIEENKPLLVLIRNHSERTIKTLPDNLNVQERVGIIMHEHESDTHNVEECRLHFRHLAEFAFSKDKGGLYNCTKNISGKQMLEDILQKLRKTKREVNPHGKNDSSAHKRSEVDKRIHAKFKQEDIKDKNVQIYDPEGSHASTSFTRCLMALLMEYNPVVHVNFVDIDKDKPLLVLIRNYSELATDFKLTIQKLPEEMNTAGTAGIIIHGEQSSDSQITEDCRRRFGLLVEFEFLKEKGGLYNCEMNISGQRLLTDFLQKRTLKQQNEACSKDLETVTVQITSERDNFRAEFEKTLQQLTELKADMADLKSQKDVAESEKEVLNGKVKALEVQLKEGKKVEQELEAPRWGRNPVFQHIDQKKKHKPMNKKEIRDKEWLSRQGSKLDDVAGEPRNSSQTKQYKYAERPDGRDLETGSQCYDSTGHLQQIYGSGQLGCPPIRIHEEKGVRRRGREPFKYFPRTPIKYHTRSLSPQPQRHTVRTEAQSGRIPTLLK